MDLKKKNARVRGPCFFRRESHWATCSQSLAPRYFELKYPAATDVFWNVEFTFNCNFSKLSGRGDCGSHTPRVMSNHTDVFQIKPRLLSLGILLSIREHLQPTGAVNTHDSAMRANEVCDSQMSRTDWHQDTAVLWNIRRPQLSLPELSA